MRLRTVLILGLAMLPVLGMAQTKKKKPSTPAIFGTAKYVYVQAEDGDMYNPRVLPEDRDAISNAMNALRAWGRYTLMPTADGTELVFIVRKGRIAGAQIGGTVGNTTNPPFGSQRPNPNQAPGVMVGGDVGPPDDFLEVRMKQPGGDLSDPIWEHSMAGGLDAPNVPLLEQLKRGVEKDYPQK
ncbi:MAG: hypothetical protein WCF17_14315 [Terracidiphilus sp.]